MEMYLISFVMEIVYGEVGEGWKILILLSSKVSYLTSFMYDYTWIIQRIFLLILLHKFVDLKEVFL